MASSLASLVVYLTGNTAQFETAMASAERTILSIGKKMLALAGIGSAGLFIKAGMDSAMAAEQLEKKLGAVLKSTQYAAGLSLSAMKQQADALRTATNTSGADITRAQTVMATFTSIQGRVFKDAMKSAVDLSSVMGQDLQSSVVQLGKALNDPLTGLNSLRRVGVSFSEEQKSQIKDLVNAGKLEAAQLIILTELQREFGGSAAAAADTVAGKMQRAEMALGSIRKTIGQLVIEAFDMGGSAGKKGAMLEGFSSDLKQNFYELKYGIQSIMIDIEAAIKTVGVWLEPVGSLLLNIPSVLTGNLAGLFNWIVDNAGRTWDNLLDLAVAGAQDWLDAMLLVPRTLIDQAPILGKAFFQAFLHPGSIGQTIDKLMDDTVANVAGKFAGIGKNLERSMGAAGFTALEMKNPGYTRLLEYFNGAVLDRSALVEAEKKYKHDNLDKNDKDNLGKKIDPLKKNKPPEVIAADAIAKAVEQKISQSLVRGSMEAAKMEQQQRHDAQLMEINRQQLGYLRTIAENSKRPAAPAKPRDYEPLEPVTAL